MAGSPPNGAARDGRRTGSSSPVARALLVGVAAAVLFIALSSERLGAQGAYQDEILPACGSFAYVGGEPIAALSIGRIPVLNNSYQGAIRTGLYGLYLRISGNGFSLVSWRLFGILFVATGLLLLPLIGGRGIDLLPLSLGLFLVVTDGTVILTTRHDWGPTALGLLIRLLMIGVLLRDDQSAGGVRRANFFLGLLLGLAVFEKLSSVVLAAPIALALVLQPPRRKPRALVALAAGCMAGLLPLIAVNAASYRSNRTLISLSDVAVDPKPTVVEFAKQFPENFLGLGAASYTRWVILGVKAGESEEHREALLLGVLLAVTAGISFWKFRQGAAFRAAAVFAISVFLIALFLYLLPRRTAIHHHVQVIPFHYVAASAALCGMLRLRREWRLVDKLATGILTAALCLLAAQHAAAAARIEKALAAGRCGVVWAPAFSAIGHFANSKRDEAVFIAADWGVYTPIYCFSQGRRNFAYEAFWNYHGPEDLERYAAASGPRIVYLVTPATGQIAPQTAARINRDAGSLATWKEVPPEPEASALRPLVVVRKFVLR